MVQSPSKPISLEEFLKLPETQLASEFIDGKVIQKTEDIEENGSIHGAKVECLNQAASCNL